VGFTCSPEALVTACSLELAFHVGGFHIAHTTWDLIQLGRHTLIAFRANTGGPLDGFSGAGAVLPLLADGGQMLGEVVSGAGTIGATDHGEFLVCAAQFTEVFDLAEEDSCQLLRGELEVTSFEVVSHSDRASRHRNLQHTSLHLGDFGFLHRFVRCTEINGVGHELTHASSGSHGLVVHRDALRLEFLEPALVDGCWEGGASAVEFSGDLVIAAVAATTGAGGEGHGGAQAGDGRQGTKAVGTTHGVRMHVDVTNGTVCSAGEGSAKRR
jgi:hypothetical protein